MSQLPSTWGGSAYVPLFPSRTLSVGLSCNCMWPRMQWPRHPGASHDRARPARCRCFTTALAIHPEHTPWAPESPEKTLHWEESKQSLQLADAATHSCSRGSCSDLATSAGRTTLSARPAHRCSDSPTRKLPNTLVKFFAEGLRDGHTDRCI